MKILKIIHGYPSNYNSGSEVYSQSICEELSKEHEVFVFTREENPYSPDFTIRFQKSNKNLSLYFVNMAHYNTLSDFLLVTNPTSFAKVIIVAK